MNLRDITTAIAAKMNFIWCETFEEDRAIKTLVQAAADRGLNSLVWSCSRGLCAITPTGTGGLTYGELYRDADPGESLSPDYIFNPAGALLKSPEPCLVVVKDISPYMEYPGLLRLMRDEMAAGKVRPRNELKIFVFVDQEPRPSRLRGIHAVDMPLPGRDIIGSVIDKTAELYGDNQAIAARATNGHRDEVIASLTGLTLDEVQDAMTLSIAACQDLDPARLMKHKKQLINTPALRFEEPDPRGLDAVGGLAALKHNLMRVKPAFSEKARKWGLPRPKGAFIAGPPGCGKSLTAKCAATLFGLPLIRMDMGAVFGSLVGESERNMRHAMKTLDVLAPCVLFIDEVEKGFSGVSSSGQTDGGTSARVFGDFLQWLNDSDNGVYVMATANNPLSLPPEFTRAGRFDDLWWVDLPSAEECADIARIMMKKWPRAGNETAVSPATIGKAAAKRQLTGAEIEGAFTAALYEAYADGRDPETSDIVAAIQNARPVVQTFGEQLKALRKWGEDRCRNAGGPAIAKNAKPTQAESRLLVIDPGAAAKPKPAGSLAGILD